MFGHVDTEIRDLCTSFSLSHLEQASVLPIFADMLVLGGRGNDHTPTLLWLEYW